MSQQQQQNGSSSFPSETTPFGSYVSFSRNSPSSLRHLNQRHLFPSTPEYPLHRPDDTFESLFSRLSVSHHNDQGYTDDDAFLESHPDRPFVASQAFSVQNLYNNNGVNSSMTLGPRDYARSTTNIRDGFVSDSVLLPNVNGITTDDSTRGFSNGLLSKTTQNYFSPALYNRRPYWLQEPSHNHYSSSSSSLAYNPRGGGGGSNLEHFMPLPLEFLMGRIVRLAKDQNGCRLVQKALESATHAEVDMVLLEVNDSIAELMFHPFGNYVVQKLVEVCSEEQRTRILVAVTKTDRQLVRICLNMHGTRAVQKLLESIASRQQVSIVARQQVSIVMAALSPSAVDLAEDMNGHHVIKYCLDHFLPEDNKYLLRVVADNCYDIATDKSGCCVLQHCVDRSIGESRDCLVAGITEIALPLAQDKYGNYVVQHLLGLGIPQITARVLSQLEGCFTALACDKYGSNVVEKCLVESTPEQSTQIISELLSSSSSLMLLQHPFGNFVIQSALKVSKGPVLGDLLKLIRENVQAMRFNIYGKKILSCLHKERLLPM